MPLPDSAHCPMKVRAHASGKKDRKSRGFQIFSGLLFFGSLLRGEIQFKQVETVRFSRRNCNVLGRLVSYDI